MTPSLLAKVKRRMSETGATQSDVASACGLSQPHISRVLRQDLKLCRKTESRLQSWLDSAAGAPPGRAQDPMHSIAAKVDALSPRKRMQFMHLLKAIDELLGR